MNSLSPYPNGSAMPQASPIPPGFTKERLNGLLQRAKLLQAQGAKEDNNPEFAQIMHFLKNLQMQSKMQQQRQSMQQTQQSSPQSSLPAAMQQLPQRPSQPQSQPSFTPPPSNNAPRTSIFTENQLAALKYQIYAFKLISKNLPLPANLQQAVFTSPNADNFPVSKEIAAAANVKLPETGSSQQTPKLAETPVSASSATPQTGGDAALIGASPSPAQYNAYVSPYSLLKMPISSYVHASRQQRLLIPALTPVGMDSEELIVERERRVKSRIQYRVQELESLPNNLTNDLPEKIAYLKDDITEAGKNGSSVKLRAIIELKALRLLEKQKKLRDDIIKGMTKATTLATSVDRSGYRRMKKQSLREARLTERSERQQRLDREEREKQKHLDYLQTICNHGRDLTSAHRMHQAKQNKLGRAVLQLHAHIEKEEQRRAERISKERIRALKADDEEAYMKLIDEAKDTRLTHLLRQTGAFLESLTRAVVDQQNDPIHTDDIDDDEVDEEMQYEDESGKKVDYYQIAHKVKERVTQPSILVGGTLKEYQLKGLQWMVSLYNNHLNGILADEMGLGKTIQTISLITYLIEYKKQNGPFLIIVPLSTLTNWTLEFEKWAPSVSTIVYKGPPNSRRALQQEVRYSNFQVLLTTFEYVIKDRPILSKVRWVNMIIDEGHRMKNARSKLVMVLRQYYHSRYRLILTGTPLQNNLPELWALLNFILPKIFNSVKSFEEWFNTPFNNQGVQDKIDLNEEEQLLIIKRLHKVLRPFLLRRLKKDVESELPDKVEHVIKCKLSGLQAKLYSQMKKSGMLYMQSGDKGRTGIKGLNNTIMQLRKICNHPFVFEEVENAINPTRQSNELLYRTAGKFELLDRMLPKLKATGHRVLIFFQMTQIMNIMEDFLHYRGYNYLRLDGSTKADDRSSLLHVFNAPDSPYFVFLLSTRAGGLGLNLQSADTVIIFDSDWNPHQDLQAQDRAHRIGQTKEVRIFRLITEKSVEEMILARANYKLDIDGKVIQAGKFDNRSTDEDREAFLRSLLEDKTEEQNDVDEEEEVDNEELNEMLKRADTEMEVFERIDNEREKEEIEIYRRKGGRGPVPERLIQEHELPDIYRNDDLYPDVVQHIELGRGQREKQSVVYDDGLTEDQWLNAIEDDNVDDVIARAEAKRRGFQYDTDSGPGTPRKRGRSRAIEEELPMASKKRGRPKKPEDARRKRGRKGADASGPDPYPPNVRAQMTRIFMQCYEAVENSIADDGDTYRVRSALFMELVSKRDYPVYYTMIQNPIAMKIIKKRIHSSYYKSIDQFKDDFHLMFNNARIFNEEGSFVYQDADEMQKIFDYTLESLCPGGTLPPLGNDDMASSGLENRHLSQLQIENDDSAASSPSRGYAGQRKKQKRITYDDEEEEEEDDDDDDDDDDVDDDDDDDNEYDG
ncbi:ATP-dependent DNA helicase Snf21 [Umbelopsis sp. WA50703]